MNKEQEDGWTESFIEEDRRYRGGGCHGLDPKGLRGTPSRQKEKDAPKSDTD